MKRRTTLYRDGVIFFGVMLMVFLSAAIRQVNLLLLFASILVCFLFFDYWLGRRLLAGLSIRRRAPSGATAGEPFLATVELINGRRRVPSWGVVVEETVRPEYVESGILERLTADGAVGFETRRRFFRRPTAKKKYAFRPVCYFEQVDPKATQRKSWAGRLPHRGRYRLGPVTLSTRFPLGFFRSSVTISDETSFVVGPKIGRIIWHKASALRESAERRAHYERHIGRLGGEMFGVRQWQPSDTRKWIHWRATAKYRKILVRQFQRRQHEATAILLDLYASEAQSTFADLENRELAVSFAATLYAERVKRFGRQTIFGMAADRVGAEKGGNESSFFLRTGSGSPAAGTVMECLATAAATRTDALAELFERVMACESTLTQLTVVTTRPFDVTVTPRLAALRQDPRFVRLARKTVVIATADPAFDELFEI